MSVVQRAWLFTPGPAYNEFGYYEDPDIANKFFLTYEYFGFASMFKKLGENGCRFNDHISMK